MRRLLLAATAAGLFALAATPASAYPHHGFRHSVHHYYHHQVHRPHQRGWRGSGYARHGGGWGSRGHGDGRPAGCPVGLWCGCYLARILGITDTAYNSAIHWLNYGHAVSGPRPGAIAVGPHHVAKLLHSVGGGRWLIQDGNDGPVRIHTRSIAWAHWFRMG
jgi:hypothetical protein